MSVTVKDPISKQLRVVLVHNVAMWYRLPFFRSLAELYDLTIFFTDASSVEGLEGVNYELTKKRFNSHTLSIFQADMFAPGLIPRLMFMDCDVMVGWVATPATFFIAKIRRKPFILWFETWHFSERESFAFRLLRPFFRFLISHSDAILVPSKMHKDETVSLGAHGTKTFIMPNVSNICVKSSDYRKAEELRSKLAQDNKRVILYVGRLDELKGVQYLIAAFSKLAAERDDISLICVGDGPSRGELESLCEELHVDGRVHFVGWVDPEMRRNKYLVPYYLLCDVCAVPSIFLRGKPDACPLVLNEAMACGKAVIATTSVGCAHDMIQNGTNGFVVPEKDSAALYTALRMVLADPTTAKTMGEAARKVIDNSFTYTHMVKGFQTAIDSLRIAD
jgi:glycosyltransferase involved in cell wall biosynthesis